MTYPFSYCLLLLVSLLALTSAVPTPVELAPRACSTVGTSNISKLNKTAPNELFNSGYFTLSRTGGSNSNTIKSVISFSYIPPGATGCMLQIDIPKLPVTQQQGPLASGTGTQADVWLITNPPRDNPYDDSFVFQYSWNNPPVKSQFVSTTIFPTTATTEERYKTYLWSGTCKQVMSFQFELSDWQQGSGDVHFFNFPFGGKGYAPLGFSMVYNC